MQMFFQSVLCLTVSTFALPCADISVTKFSYGGYSHWFANLFCGAQFTCHDVAVIPNQHSDLIFGLHHCCYG